MTVNYKIFFMNPKTLISIDFGGLFHKVFHKLSTERFIDTSFFPLYILSVLKNAISSVFQAVFLKNDTNKETGVSRAFFKKIIKKWDGKANENHQEKR